MKKVITIFLVLLFTVNEFSFITIYLPLKNLAGIIQKAKVENSYDSNDFTLIAINESEKESIKYINENEIFFNGDMYDIVNTVTKDSTIYIYCLKDETENLLTKSFQLHFDNHQNRKFSLNFFNLTSAKKLIAFVFEDNLNNSILKVDSIIADNINLNPKPFIDKHTPPPKIS